MRNRDFPSLLLYAFGFLLLWEWLRPIEQLTDTDHMGTFIVFLLFSFALSFFNIKGIWQFMMKVLFILFSINRIHYEEGLLHLSWLNSFIRNINENLGLVFSRDWNDLSNEFRSLLFFVLLWLMVYLIQYWLLNRQRIFLFFFMTLIYISVLDTFTPYNAKLAIVRTVVAGFAAMGMLTFYRMNTKENVNLENAFIRKWMVPLAVMIAFSVLLGIASPKAAPIWPDPVPYLQGNQKDGTKDDVGGLQRIGYGTNDTNLGGPFLRDKKSVFRIEANGKNYWKVETKDLYTGKGWLPSGSTPISFKQGDLVPVFSIPKSVETIKETAKIVVANDYQFPHIIYPAGIQRITKVYPSFGDDNIFEIDTTKERILAYDDKRQPIVPNLYSIDFDIPKYKAADLVKTTKMIESTGAAEFLGQYTQLPENLPARIKALAEKITAGKHNWFDKAKAIENYFDSADYIYDQKNVAIPGNNDDYVDQFLFETKRGYCDNFSSSMAVLLRTLGIPTRWVKGYTSGEFLQYSTEDPSKQIYQITNNNAHSWVEVFLPNQGWVPFEPTKGFTNELNISYETAGSKSANNQTTTPPPVKKPLQKPLNESEESQGSKKSVDNQNMGLTTKLFLKNNWKMVVLIFALIGIAGGILYRIRGKWFPYYLLLRYRFKKKDENIAIAYLNLLHQLERYGLTRKENQTLRNYARYVDTFFSTKEMTRLTAAYEQYLYHQNLPHGSWEEVRKLWENLIKKTIA